jgi:hypothetical protein
MKKNILILGLITLTTGQSLLKKSARIVKNSWLNAFIPEV